MSTAHLIAEECDALKTLLLAKNAAYGDSALDPLRVFSKSSPVEQILVRLDDKLSRLARGQAAGEDVVLDLLGYLVLLRIAQKKQSAEHMDRESLMDRVAAYRRGTEREDDSLTLSERP